MPMPAQTWDRAAASFLGMWVAMTVAMMLPSVTPVLWRYRRALWSAGETRPRSRVGLVAGGYLFVWTVVGVAVYALGVALAAAEARVPVLGRVMPTLAGIAVLIGGALQSTTWKARHLASCKEVPRHGTGPVTAAAAWRTGVCFGVHCVQSCAGLMLVVVSGGVMNLTLMTAVAAAITTERLAPRGERLARVIGVAVVCVAVMLIARAAGHLLSA